LPGGWTRLQEAVAAPQEDAHRKQEDGRRKQEAASPAQEDGFAKQEDGRAAQDIAHFISILTPEAIFG
jgi:hypothetical protein